MQVSLLNNDYEKIMKELEKLYLEKQALDEMNLLIRRYTRYHLDIPDLKSETLLLEK